MSCVPMSEPREEAWLLLEGELVLGRETREQCLKPEVGCVNDSYEYE